MNKTDIKRVIGNLAPDKEMEYIIKKIIQKHSNKFDLKPIVSIASSLAIIICIGILRYNFVEKKNNVSPHITNSTEGVYISTINERK